DRNRIGPRDQIRIERHRLEGRLSLCSEGDVRDTADLSNVHAVDKDLRKVVSRDLNGTGRLCAQREGLLQYRDLERSFRAWLHVAAQNPMSTGSSRGIGGPARGGSRPVDNRIRETIRG